MQRSLHSPSLGSSLLYDMDSAQATPVSPAMNPSVTSWSLSPSMAPAMTPWQLALADTLEREEQDVKATQRAAAAAPSAASFYNPDAWRRAFKSMTRTALFQSNQISLFHDAKAGLNLEQDLRLGCCVRILPRLSVIKAALQKLAQRNSRRKASTYDMWESAATGSVTPASRIGERGRANRRAAPSSAAAAKDTDHVVPSYQPAPTLWAVSDGNDQAILVFDAFTGRRLMRIADPKLNVAPTAIAHAPFRGFMNRQLHVLPVNKPQDILRLKESQLVNTDYVWVGFADGAIRLFPADHERIRESDRATQLSKGELADIVFELPKHHAASIISIVRSPCHHDTDGADYATRNRLSSAVHYMTAAGTSSANSATGATATEGKKKGTREHLSLMCTASVDSIVVVWDIRKIYQALEAIRAVHREEMLSGGLTSTRSAVSVLSNEVVTLEGAHPLFTVRSSCTMVKVRPLMRLKGGVAGFKSLQWVSTLVTSAGFEQPRQVAELTRDPEESSAPKLLRQRRHHQRLTRFERREEHRKMLQLGEEDMKALESLLDEMMPSLKEEPVQSMRVNLLVAGDNVGTVHVWNLDEELHKNASDTIATARSIRSTVTTPHKSPSRMESPGRQSNFSAAQYSTASPSVQLSATTSVRTKDRTRTAAGKLKSLKDHHKQKAQAGVSSSGTSATGAGAATPLGQKIGSGSTGGGSAVKKTPRSTQKGGASSAKKKKPSTPSRGSAVKKGPEAASSTTTVPARATGRLTSLGTVSTGPHPRPATSLGLTSTTLTASSAASAAPKPHKRAMPLLSRPGTAVHSGAGATGAATTTTTGAHPAPRASLSSLRSSASPSRARPSLVLSESSLDRQGAVGLAAQSSTARQAGSTARSATRPSPSRPSTHRDGPRGSSSPSKRAAASVERTARARANDYLSRASQCRIEFTGGVAITGMAVDLPPVLVRTLRRLPEPQTERVSLLEQPTAEQVLRRTLENEFDVLTEEKALYFAFEQLQMYVSVEGTVLNLRCAPRWHAADADGQSLFMIHHTADSDLQRLAPVYRPSPQQNERRISGEVNFHDFDVEFHKTILEGHSQPVSALFLDVTRRLVWVARNGGLMSLFSTDTKKVVTRVPHPSADAALGPPNAAEWRAQQAEFLRHQDEPLHLARHKETLKYKPAFFRDMIPFSTRTQGTMVLVSAAVDADFIDGRDLMLGDLDDDYYHPSPSSHYLDGHHLSHSQNALLSSGSVGLSDGGGRAWLSSPRPSDGLLEAQRIEGRSDMALPARRREKRLKEVLDHMRLCRLSAVLVRKAEKEEYEQYGERISANVAYIVREIGAYAALPILRHAFHQWQTHSQHFAHAHVMRQQRTARLARARYLALGLERNCLRQVTAQYFVKFLRWRALRRINQQDECLSRLLERLSGARKQPSSEMMARLWEWRTRQQCWRVWQRFAGCEPAGAAALLPPPTLASTMHESLNTSPCKPGGEGGAGRRVDGREGSPLQRTATAKYRTSSIVGGHMSGAHRTRPATVRGVTGAVAGGVLHYDDDGEDNVEGNENRDGDGEDEAVGDVVDLRDATSVYADMQAAAAAAHTPGPDAEMDTLLEQFRHVTYVILHSRAAIMRFQESEATPDSVLDESWMSIVESAEAGADDQSNPDSRRLSVFRYGLLALLQGLLSTADDVLPNLDNDSIADEVVSMLLGIQLCMDYIAADADVTLSKVDDRFVAATLFKSLVAEDSPRRSRSLLQSTIPFLTRTATQAPHSLRATSSRQRRPSHDSTDSAPPSAVNPLLLSHEDACLCVLEVYARRALEDPESREAMAEIVNDRESLDVFISFVSEERPERLRSVSAARS